MDELWMPGRLRVEVLLDAQEADGAFCLLADYPPPGWSLPPHRHLDEAETIYIVAGHFNFHAQGKR